MSELNLELFKEKLEGEKERILKNIEAINDELATIAAEDEIDDIEDLTELKLENDRDKAKLKILVQELKDVNDALRKIAEGTYGIDENTGESIPIDRLMANPAARTA